MKIRNRKTGAVGHLPNDFLTQVLIDHGLIEIAPAEPVKTGTPRTTWSVGEVHSTGEATVEAHCVTCNMREVFLNANESCFMAHCGVVEKVPADVLADYRKQRSGYVPPRPKIERTVLVG